MKKYKGMFRNLEKREAEPMVQMLKEASELIENLFILSHKEFVGKEAVVNAYKQNLERGGTIAYVDKTQNKIKEIIESFKWAWFENPQAKNL